MLMLQHFISLQFTFSTFINNNLEFLPFCGRLISSYTILSTVVTSYEEENNACDKKGNGGPTQG